MKFDMQAEMHELLAALRDDALTLDQKRRLEQLVIDDPQARHLYAEYVTLIATLRWSYAHESSEFTSPCACLSENGPAAASSGKQAVAAEEAAAIPAGTSAGLWQRFAHELHPRRHPFLFAGTVASLTLLFWLGFYVLTSPGLPVATFSGSEVPAGTMAAGRLTKTKGVKWRDASRHWQVNDVVHAGDLLEMEAGLLEVTFASGATVLLDGPCRFQAVLPTEARLLSGRAVAKVPQPAHGFAIAIPQARVVDLGTEFGVHTDAEGNSQIAVFDGRVRVTPADTSADWLPIEISAGEELAVGRNGPLDRAAQPQSEEQVAFTREIPEEQLALDLADIVGGGDGRGRKVNRGIAFDSGKFVTRFSGEYVSAAGTFQPVQQSTLVDGVFLLPPKSQPQQLSSTGVEFTFPENDGRSWGQAWAFEIRQGDPASQTWLDPLDISAGRLVHLHPNAGLTIDLQKIQQRFANYAPRRLTGYVSSEFIAKHRGRGNKAVVWVIVDGQVRHTPIELTSGGPVVHVNVDLAAGDRFLTLASTDGGDRLFCDFVFWRHARLLLKANDREKASEN